MNNVKCIKQCPVYSKHLINGINFLSLGSLGNRVWGKNLGAKTLLISPILGKQEWWKKGERQSRTENTWKCITKPATALQHQLECLHLFTDVHEATAFLSYLSGWGKKNLPSSSCLYVSKFVPWGSDSLTLPSYMCISSATWSSQGRKCQACDIGIIPD